MCAYGAGDVALCTRGSKVVHRRNGQRLATRSDRVSHFVSFIATPLRTQLVQRATTGSRLLTSAEVAERTRALVGHHRAGSPRMTVGTRNGRKSSPPAPSPISSAGPFRQTEREAFERLFAIARPFLSRPGRVTHPQSNPPKGCWGQAGPLQPCSHAESAWLRGSGCQSAGNAHVVLSRCCPRKAEHDNGPRGVEHSRPSARRKCFRGRCSSSIHLSPVVTCRGMVELRQSAPRLCDGEAV